MRPPLLLLLIPLTAAAEEPEPWYKLSLDARIRYEVREAIGQDVSHAPTVRLRPGLLLGHESSLSFFVEGEFTRAMGEDYSAGSGAPPVNQGNTTISDSINEEVNQAWVRYKYEGFSAMIGRQRIILDDAAFIGNSAWTQNEQTFDAATVSYATKQFSLSYTYSDRVQRIFGENAEPFGAEMKGNFHFFHGTVEIGEGQLGFYNYFIDVKPNGGASRNVDQNNSAGVFYQRGGFYAEAAWQNGRSALVGNSTYNAVYAHIHQDLEAGGFLFTPGVEYLGKDFKTPFATLHAFNGFADAFLAQRAGFNDLGGRYEGLTDVYLNTKFPALPGDIDLTSSLHYYADDSLNRTYGYEMDAVLSKKINKYLTVSLQAAYFISDDGAAGYTDIKQLALGLDFKW